MDMHMDTNEKPGQSPPLPGQSPARGTLRRRIVFELEEDQLPLLEAAEARHGSKRAALLAALAAEPEAADLRERAERAEAEVARKERGAEKAKKGKAEGEAKLQRELDAAKRKLAKAEKAGADGDAELRQQIDDLGERLADAEEELADLRPSAVDWLPCNRCGKWAAPEDWEWVELEESGSYAYHRPCGDHDESIKGSSRLAQRA
jgi:hypothetical protein